MRRSRTTSGTARRLLAIGVSLAAILVGGIAPATGAHGATALAAPHRGGTLNFNLGVVFDCADAAKSGELEASGLGMQTGCGSRQLAVAPT